MHGRFWVPKNICFYLFFFLAALSGWVGTLFLYYHNSKIAALVSEESIPFMDFNHAGNIGQWFLSLVWLAISVFSFMMVAFVISRSRQHLADASTPQQINGISIEDIARYHGISRALFWGGAGFFALVMSADTVCRFSPYLYALLAGEFRSHLTGDGDRSLFIVCLIAGGLAAAAIAFTALHGYIKAVRCSRRLLVASFTATFLFLVPSFFFAFSVPKTSYNTAKRELPDHVLATRCEGSPEFDQSSGGDRFETEEDDLEEKTTSNDSDYRTVSFETANLECEKITWESIFGMGVSIEKRLRLAKPAEEYLRLKKPIEDYLFDRFPELNLIQTRTLLRHGFYGVFLVLLAMSFGLLARAERLEYDTLITFQTFLRFQGPTGIQSPKVFKDLWKFSK
jgi:hypothetical protein